MNLLWIKAGGLVPLDSGGKIRSFHILKELTRNHQITLYTYYGEHANDKHSDLSSLFARVVSRPLKMPAARSLSDYANYARQALSPYPYTMRKYYRPEIEADILRLSEAEQYDVIICDFLFPARVTPWSATCPKVIFTHNVEAAIYRRHYETTRNLIWKVGAWREYRATERAEQRYLRQADHVLTVSEADRKVFARIVDPSKISTIPTGVDLEYFQTDTKCCEPGTLVFTGSMDWILTKMECFSLLIRFSLTSKRRCRMFPL